ncbi:S1 family peptidase [Dokdonella koreensis]|uniref:Serine endopeptidase n=1 Tax=Dokdonella koreensis DS-123 TaxID=1300342 RepID=A0A167GBX9_9GAMM|nr:trypsin-like serine protease [Dokdonella koreensis]ANB16384.1 Serine endopeptidase [Dokdonella koreensis DS-123]
MIRYLLLVMFAAPLTASAVVIRHDVEDAKYRIPASVFPALADLPGEGQGVLIAPHWVVTAAHAVPSQGLDDVTIGGVARKVERVVAHPGYKRLPEALGKQAVASGDASEVMAFLANVDDIALVRLAAPVADVAPVVLYRQSDEIGRTVTLIGKGATGTGIEGQGLHAYHRTELRRAFNVVTGADVRWLSYTFDAPPAGLPLEGITGSGDSGGPVLVDADGGQQLAGLASWNKYAQSSVRPFHAGLYGQVVYSVRISRYAGWIDGVMSAGSAGD